MIKSCGREYEFIEIKVYDMIVLLLSRMIIGEVSSQHKYKVDDTIDIYVDEWVAKDYT